MVERIEASRGLLLGLYALESGAIEDALIAQSEGQRASFWQVRERIPEANRLVGAIVSHDISLPLSRLRIADKPLDQLRFEDFELVGYQSHDAIKFKVAV